MKSLIAILAILSVVSAGMPSTQDVTFDMVMRALSPVQVALSGKSAEGIFDPIVEFFKGLVEGIKDGYTTDLEYINSCIAAPLTIWEIWVEFYDYCKELNWTTFDISDFGNQLMQVAMSTLTQVIPCYMIYSTGQKFVTLIMTPTLDTLKSVLMQSLLTNAQTLINNGMAMFNAILEADYFSVGEILSLSVYMVIIH